MAIVADRLEVANYLFVKAHVDKHTQIPPPKPIARPGAEPEPQPVATAADIARFFGPNVQYANGGGTS